MESEEADLSQGASRAVAAQKPVRLALLLGAQDRTVGARNDCGWVRSGLSGGMDVAHPQPAADGGEITASPRDRLIEAATRLFCRYGINSVGVDEIVAAAGTAKTTLYRLFGSKDGLVEAVLECEGRAWRAWFLAEIDNAGGPPLARLNRIGGTLRLWFAREDFYGCPFINAVAESDKTDNRMRSLAIAHKKIVLERLATLCAEAGLKQPTEVAHSLGLVIDGAIVAALVTGNASVADTAGRTCAAILSDAKA
jgi:AcrR family transcriptional regulator